jgi:predicted TIM-barrel fold metal-dependent hydrolase
MTTTDLPVTPRTGLNLEDYKNAVADTRVLRRRWESAGTTEAVVIVSVDSHVSPPVEDYRQYCPKEYLEDFDEFAAPEVQARIVAQSPPNVARTLREAAGSEEAYVKQNPVLAALDVLLSDDRIGYDPRTRLSRMDEDGIAAEVIFHGGSDFLPVPFIAGGDEDLPMAPELTGLVGAPWKRGPEGAALAAAGMRMYNRWVADFCSEAPGRFLGLALLPMWDVDAAVREVEFAREIGLVGVNFPAPRPMLTSYGDPMWEPLWSVCESLDMKLNTHISSAGRTAALGNHSGPNYGAAMMLDLGFASRRAIPMMIYGLVFDRHPGLKMVITETSADWVPGMLHDLDSQQWGSSNVIGVPMARKPSEYFWSNVYIGDSFMSNHEARTAVADGTVGSVMWGRDYPHPEGVWPYTRFSIRNTMEGVPVDAARQMLGLNAVDVFGLDLTQLQSVANQIGPAVDEVMRPLTADEIPAGRAFGSGFRAPGQGVL